MISSKYFQRFSKCVFFCVYCGCGWQTCFWWTSSATKNLENNNISAPPHSIIPNWEKLNWIFLETLSTRIDSCLGSQLLFKNKVSMNGLERDKATGIHGSWSGGFSWIWTALFPGLWDGPERRCADLHSLVDYSAIEAVKPSYPLDGTENTGW